MYNMSETATKTTGRVKWFNKNSGYGFITAVDGDHCDEDIFVHHSALTVEKDQFRYLVDGEYVSFEWSTSGKESEGRKWQASNVTGVCSGPLMCETQNAARENSSSRDGDDEDEEGGSSSRPQRRFRGGPPRFTDSNGEEYHLVRNRGSRGQHKSKSSSSATASSSASE